MKSTPATRTNVPTLTGDGTAAGTSSLSDAQTPLVGAGGTSGTDQVLIYVLFGLVALFMAGCAFFADLYVASRKKAAAA